MVDSPQRILVYPAGSEIGLELFASLNNNKHFELLAASSVPSHARCLFSGGEHYLPWVGDSDFISKLNFLIDQLGVDIIFPAHDSVILEMSKRRSDIQAMVLCPSAEVCEVTQFKAATYDQLAGTDFLPTVYKSVAEISEFPIFRKPSRGQGSVGAGKFDTLEELVAIPDPFSGYVISEYLPGDEYTIDCFTNRNGELLYCQPRVRVRTKSGISMNSKSVDLSKTNVFEIAKTIVEKIPISGAWFFQLRKDRKGELKLLEVAPRIAGTSVTARYSGVNLAAMTVYDSLGIEVKVIDNEIQVEIERALYSRAVRQHDFQSLAVDLDDTLISPCGKVNIDVIALIYQFRQAEKPVFLITRHAKNVAATLTKHYIDLGLFSEIHHLTNFEPKSSVVISAKRACLFVDDAFSERQEVSQNVAQVAVIDVDAVVGFLDFRH